MVYILYHSHYYDGGYDVIHIFDTEEEFQKYFQENYNTGPISSGGGGITGYQLHMPGTKTINQYTDKTAIEIVRLDVFLTEEYMSKYSEPPRVVRICLRNENLIKLE